MKALMDELKSNGCILQGREPLVEKILAKHLENLPKHASFNGKMVTIEREPPYKSFYEGQWMPELAEIPDDAV